jgi:arylsulfatase A-like enzyme
MLLRALGLSVGILGLSALAAPQSAAPQRHNVLFIGTDQQRTSTLGCYGNDWAHSPNIDKIVEESSEF